VSFNASLPETLINPSVTIFFSVSGKLALNDTLKASQYNDIPYNNEFLNNNIYAF